MILAAQFNPGQPTEGVGWELSAIASVVVGGTLLTGGMGSVGTTLVGVLLLGLIFNILNFENGRGVISLSVYWQSVIRGRLSAGRRPAPEPADAPPRKLNGILGYPIEEDAPMQVDLAYGRGRLAVEVPEHGGSDHAARAAGPAR